MKTTANNTVPFKQRDEEKRISKYYKINNKNTTNSTIVIPYPKYRKKKKNGVRFIKHNKPLLIILILMISFSLISFVDGKMKFNNTSSSSNKQATNNSNSKEILTPSEFKNNSKIISTEVRQILSLDSSYEIKTNSMHRNGNSIYAQGSYANPAKNKVYFDILLKDKKASSLVIDGIEYIK